MAAPGFGSWIDDYPSQIDWYGIKQVAHYLFIPLVDQSSLSLDYLQQADKTAHDLFVKLSYPMEDIKSFEALLKILDDKCTEFKDLSDKKIVKRYKGDLSINSQGDLQKIAAKLIRGLSLIHERWKVGNNSSRFFPVHYYGLGINQGLAFSDIGILWSCDKLMSLIDTNNFGVEPYKKLKENIIKKTIADFDKESNFPGLFDGVIGSIWIIYELGEKELAKHLFYERFIDLLENSVTKNLYNGTAGVLLVGLYFISKVKLEDHEIHNYIIAKTEVFAKEYKENPDSFCKVGAGDVQSNDPYKNEGGLFYGHAGLGWLFGEAYRLTSNNLFKECLNVAIDTELKSYSNDSLGSLQYQQGKRLLPYLSTGSAGLITLISKNRDYVVPELLKIQGHLIKAVKPNFCVFPGLFNGFCGLTLSEMIYTDNQNKLSKQRQLFEGLFPYLSVIEKGLVLAGDSGLKVTMDIASGFGGIALSLVSLQNNKLELLPSI